MDRLQVTQKLSYLKGEIEKIRKLQMEAKFLDQKVGKEMQEFFKNIGMGDQVHLLDVLQKGMDLK